MKNKKTNKKIKAFTLIELLAVIVLLAVIALITTPIVIGAIDSAKEKSYTESLRFLINATDNYIMSNNFEDIPKEGIDATNENIKMNNKKFISGKVYRDKDNNLYLDVVTDGVYCGSGTLKDMEVVKGDCSQLDKTKPIITVGVGITTSKSIQVLVSAKDIESGIKSYEYSIDNGKTYKKVNSNIHVFDNLEKDKEYTIKVRVTNGNDLVAIAETTGKTKDIVAPTYAVDKEGWQKKKIVTITYPTGTGLTYSYSIDNGKTWIDAVSIQKVEFNTNGNIFARITDGTNVVSASPLTVMQIDTTVPTCGDITGESTTWTGSDRTLTVKCSDNGECSQSIFSQLFNSTTETSNLVISDKAGNETSCPVNVYVDKTKYTVSINQAIGGTISTNVSSAMMGETVKVTATTNANYELLTLTWNGNSIVNGASFVMPRGNANITGSFKLSVITKYRTRGYTGWGGWTTSYCAPGVLCQTTTLYSSRTCSSGQQIGGGHRPDCTGHYDICNKDGTFYPSGNCSPSFCKGAGFCAVQTVHDYSYCSGWSGWTTSPCSGGNCQTTTGYSARGYTAWSGWTTSACTASNLCEVAQCRGDSANSECNPM